MLPDLVWQTIPVMKRSDLIQQLATANPQLTAKDIDLTVREIFDAMSQALARGGRIEIRGFGSFGINHLAPREGRNPRTGAAVMVPAKHVPHFKAGKELRERVDKA